VFQSPQDRDTGIRNKKGKNIGPHAQLFHEMVVWQIIGKVVILV
jgi:hypothetical protein